MTLTTASAPGWQSAGRRSVVAVPEVRVEAEFGGEPLLPHAGREDQHHAGTAGVVVLGDGPQAVVEGTAPQRQPLAHHSEAAAIVPGDHGVKAAPAVELHLGAQPLHAGGERGGESIDGGHRVHAADEQRQPLPGHRVGPNEVRGRREAEEPGGLSDAVGRQEVSLARRQVGGAVADPPGVAVGQQVGQCSVDGRVRLAEDACQLRRVDERRPAEGVK